MTKKYANPLLKLILVLSIIVILGLGVIALFSTNHSKNNRYPRSFATQKQNNDQATSDTPAESLKTLTAELSNVEQQNKKIISDNQDLKQHNNQVLTQLKYSLLQKIDRTLSKKQRSAIPTQSATTTKTGKITKYPIKMTTQNDWIQNLTWVNDMQTHYLPNHKKQSSNIDQLASVLNPGTAVQTSTTHTTKGNSLQKTIPYYTIPVGATLTGAALMEPLIGRIPINNHVPDPYHFKIILGVKNLAANGVNIPSNIAGIVATGYATGDMLRSCAMGNITNMTFVFPDGRISTTESKQEGRLGYISAENGDPCIAGSFHTNAAEYLGGSSALAGIQGYANALSQAQTVSTDTSSNQYPSISTIIKNGNRYALGQGISAGAASALNWWNARVQNSFDYVFVPNLSKTGHLTKVDIHIEKQIDIDYQKTGRKVSYQHTTNPYHSQQLD